MTTNTHEKEAALVTIQEVSRSGDALESKSSTTVVPTLQDARTPNTAATDTRIGQPSPTKYGKALVRLADQVMAIFGRIFGPPASEQDRIQSQAIKARYDSYISFRR